LERHEISALESGNHATGIDFTLSTRKEAEGFCKDGRIEIPRYKTSKTSWLDQVITSGKLHVSGGT
jgi:hypothetical protein